MEAFRVAALAEPRIGGRFPGGAEVIAQLGEAAFPRLLFAAARELTDTHHLSAFVFRGDSQPRVLVAENLGAHPVSPRIAALYAERFWRFDLVNAVRTRARQGAATWCVRTAAAEIPQDEYKAHCYTSANLANRICITRCDRDREIRLNFYSRRGRDFGEHEIDNIVGWSDILLALLGKHDSLRRVEAAASPASFAERLRRLPAGLPPREIEVCDGILQGVSSEGIALRLGLSINTVRTYRKRAYARLHVSSQNELMRLVSH